MANWFNLDTFHSESDEQEDSAQVAQRSGRDPFQFDASNYERDVARNTFLNRIECDPGLTPYDTDNASKRMSGSMPIASFRYSGEASPLTRKFYDPQFLRSEAATPKLGADLSWIWGPRKLTEI